jgi:hypothetical protein
LVGRGFKRGERNVSFLAISTLLTISEISWDDFPRSWMMFPLR